ncbi:sialin [Bacillus rossius redtenbacheri]|uniref:sialin n=1 Tax=Bacillus rossius redtenbacheri TaxID=93214 RepID=UPI002FDCA5F0
MPSTSNKSFVRKVSGMLTCKQVLNIMVILGFMFNYMLRVNLTIAIVAMVTPSNNTDGAGHAAPAESQCSGLQPVEASGPELGRNLTRSTYQPAPAEELQQTRYDWDEFQQNLILGSFFWGYLATEVPGGRLAEVFGARRVFGCSMLAASLLTVLVPAAASASYVAVVVLRVLLGLMLGATWPAIHPMTALWIPPMERSQFMSNMMASSLGAAITMPVCGYLIAAVGWQSVFYVTGLVGVAWSVVWFLVVFDSPAQHPRISREERETIEKAIGGSASHSRPKSVPWRQIFTSMPVWAIVITHTASIFGYFTIVNQLPTYMKYILNFNIKSNGWFSSLPYLGKYVFAVATSMLCDYLRRTGRLTTTQARKIFTTVALSLPACLMVAQMFLGCDRVASVTFFTMALTWNGAVTAGYLGNGLDIAPNFSGTIFGMANTLSSIGGFLSSLMVGSLTHNNQTYEQWRVVFGVLVGTYSAGAVMYLVFGTGELQSWNSAKQSEDEESTAKEAVPLKNGVST